MEYDRPHAGETFHSEDLIALIILSEKVILGTVFQACEYMFMFTSGITIHNKKFKAQK